MATNVPHGHVAAIAAQAGVLGLPGPPIYRNVTFEATEEAKAERYPNRIFTDEASFTESDLSFVDFDTFSSDDFASGTYS